MSMTVHIVSGITVHIMLNTMTPYARTDAHIMLNTLTPYARTDAFIIPRFIADGHVPVAFGKIMPGILLSAIDYEHIFFSESGPPAEALHYAFGIELPKNWATIRAIRGFT